VRGNYIGLDSNGSAGLGNGGDGVFLSDAPGNTIGGTAGGAKNVISDNGSMGVEVLGIASSGNLVQGNFIGTDLTGGLDLGNAQHGVFVNGAPDNTIGGTTTGARNVVSGNGTGVFIQNGGATGNDVVGNFIGTNAIGTGDVGNTFDGVRLGGDASNNVVGGPNFADANIIAYNGGDGVDLDATAGTGNRIQRSTIFSNDGLGIDLFPDGVTPNDPGDGDTGPNNLQNYPVLTSANSTLSGTTIVGTLNSTVNTTFSIYFFSDVSCDPSTHGEGRTFIGSAIVVTDGTGNIGFNVTVPGIAANGQVVNATATDPAGNTSEFSQCRTATGVAQPSLKQGDVNCDNLVNSVDALLVLRFGAGLSVNQTQPCPVIGTVLTLAGVFGDVDCTGAVSSVDALKVLRFVAALPVAQTEPPPCTDLGQVLP
jgi:titin